MSHMRFGSQGDESVSSWQGGAHETEFVYGLGGNDVLNGADREDVPDYLFGDRLPGDTPSGGEILPPIVAQKEGSHWGDQEGRRATINNERGVPGNDTLYGGAGDDWLYGNQGDDDLYGGTGNDIHYGGDGNDYIDGWEGNDSLYGGMGNDVLVAWTGNDLIYGGDNNDWLDGSYDNDTLYAGGGDDILGNAFLQGEAGDDIMYGEGGYDALYGGEGNDVLNGYGNGIERDTLMGGANADQFVLGTNAGAFYSEDGVLGYATIVDFHKNSQGDQIIVYGIKDDYRLDTSSNFSGDLTKDTAIYYHDDLIGIVEDKIYTSRSELLTFV